MLVSEFYELTAGCTALVVNLDCVKDRIVGDLVATYFLEVSLNVCVLLLTELKSELFETVLRMSRKITFILSPIATRKFWLIGRNVSQIVGVMIPSN